MFWWVGSRFVCISCKAFRTRVTQYTFLPMVSHYSTDCRWWLCAQKSSSGPLNCRVEEYYELANTDEMKQFSDFSKTSAFSWDQNVFNTFVRPPSYTQCTEMHTIWWGTLNVNWILTELNVYQFKTDRNIVLPRLCIVKHFKLVSQLGVCSFLVTEICISLYCVFFTSVFGQLTIY